jgi:NADH-quinone oxidoreductase subunit C
MICEKTKLALEKLFSLPQEPKTVEEVDKENIEETAEDNQQQAGKKEQQKEQPRTNGVLERDYAVHGYHLDVQLDPEQLLEAVTIIDGAEFFIESITGVDWIKDDQLEVVYDFCRYDFDLCRVVIRTRLERKDPQLTTITGIYAGANWHERETAEFFGITFIDHPHLVPLLLPEDADFHPLLKDFKA